MSFSNLTETTFTEEEWHLLILGVELIQEIERQKRELSREGKSRRVSTSFDAVAAELRAALPENGLAYISSLEERAESIKATEGRLGSLDHDWLEQCFKWVGVGFGAAFMVSLITGLVAGWDRLWEADAGSIWSHSLVGGGLFGLGIALIFLVFGVNSAVNERREFKKLVRSMSPDSAIALLTLFPDTAKSLAKHYQPPDC